MTERLQSVTQVYIDDESGETREVTTEYDESGNAIPPKEAEGEAPGTEETKAPASDDDPLPDTFPARAAFARAGITTYGQVEAELRSRPLTLIEGVDSLQADAAQQFASTHKVEVVAAEAEAKKEADAKAAEEAAAAEAAAQAAPAPEATVEAAP